jgi:hypothetical protein
MADPLKGLYTQKRYFRHEWNLAQERLAPLGGKLEPGVHDYEAFIFTAPGLRLIFYPHTTKSTGNQHIRVRASKCTDRNMLKRAIYALAENSCTFSFPTERALHDEGVMLRLKREREELHARYLARQQQEKSNASQ